MRFINIFNMFLNPQMSILSKSLFGGSVVIAFFCGLYNVFGKSLPPGPYAGAGYRLVETTEKYPQIMVRRL
jgi:hypothetical protein